MNIYEFITPSDPITFKTDCDKVAFACSLILGRGKAGTKRIENGEEKRIETLLLFCPNPDEIIKENLGKDLDVFIEENKPKIKECFKSFCYGNIEDRRTYDDALESITDPEKLKAFKAKHEDRNRTSMSEWVQGAWNYAERI